MTVIVAILVSIKLFFVFRTIYMYAYWPRRGIPMLSSKLRSGAAVSVATLARIASRNYDFMKKQCLKYSGVFNIFQPVLVVIDLDLIREILFDPIRVHFLDEGFHFSCDLVLRSGDPLQLDVDDLEGYCKNLAPDFEAEDLKTVKNSILKASDVMSETLSKYATEKREIDVAEFLTCFTTDLIGLECFEMNLHSFENSETKSQRWPIIGNLIHNVRFKAIFEHQTLSSFFNLQGSEEEIALFVHDRIRESLRTREQCKGGGYFTDLLLYLHERQKLAPESQKKMDKCYILKITQLTLFFNESFDVTCSTLYFAIYELCRNPDMQERARKEIEQTLQKYGGEVNGDSLNEMAYLQLVILETLRMYPPVATYLRICIDDYKVKLEDLTIKKGTWVMVPLFAIHRDPKYCPDPDKFDPERFNPTNTLNPPRLFMPYGEGPRLWISIHASLLQCKIGLIDILRRCRLSLSPRTSMPLQMDPEIYIRSSEKLYIRAENL